MGITYFIYYIKSIDAYVLDRRTAAREGRQPKGDTGNLETGEQLLTNISGARGALIKI
jgi:hypothetical protein